MLESLSFTVHICFLVNMKKQAPIFYSFLLNFLIHCTTSSAQSLAQPPAPAGPTNVTKILEKAGQFTILIRLFKATAVGDQINSQLNNSNKGITIFAPTDNAFSSLKAGTLNSLTDQQQVQLVQFHIIPTFLSTAQFQTVSNPLRTQAGDSQSGEFPLNITTSGNSVNVSTGIVDTSLSNAIYSDNQLAVYQVDKVLLPLAIFAPNTLAPALAPSASKKKSKGSTSDSPSSDDASVDASGAESLAMHRMMLFIGVAVIAAFSL